MTDLFAAGAGFYCSWDNCDGLRLLVNDFCWMDGLLVWGELFGQLGIALNVLNNACFATWINARRAQFAFFPGRGGKTVMMADGSSRKMAKPSSTK